MTRARLCKQSIDGILSHRRKLIAGALLLTTGGVIQMARSVLTKTSNSPALNVSAATTAHGENVIKLARPAIPAVERLPRVLITIRPTGFDPDEITLPDGRFLLAIDNKSGLDAVRLRLSREGGPAREVAMSSGRHKWREKMNLAAGTYVLTEAAHSDWRCRLTVVQ